MAMSRERHSAVVVDTARSPHARLRPVPVDAVQLEDRFWAPRRRLVREVMLPAQYRALEETGRLDNFRRAAGTKSGPFEGFYFNDSDVYKWLEAASWALASDPDEDLDRLVDQIIAEVAAAQLPDGYLDNYYLGERITDRWTELTRTHELYCAGHLFQAAVAHYRATGKTNLLDIARRFADHICDRFGPAEQGKQPGTDGHEEVEMALVELHRATGERRYLDQAGYFLDARGYGLVGGDEYHQDHMPFRELETIVGHAVRALYLNAGAADLYAETGDPTLLSALDRLWHNMVTARMYVSGGLGARHDGEAFGADFELPNERAYAETCAAIASVMWNWRMLLLTGEARFADLLEHTLYNAVLPGVSLDGTGYFYDNPLAAAGTHRRQPWFSCACCPPNLARLLASLPGYGYTTSDEGLWLHLYAEGAAELALDGVGTVRLRQQSRYPWDGEVTIDFDSVGESVGAGEFALFLRIPAWCEAGASLEVNGELYDSALRPGSYARIERTWRPGDRLRLTLPMPPRRIEAHPYVVEDAGRVALMRGPILYCAEQADNPEVDPRDIVIADEEEIAVEPGTGLLSGMPLLRLDAMSIPPEDGWDGRLYRTRDPLVAPAAHRLRLTLIPYHAWANRQTGRMTVWLRRAGNP